MIEEQFLKFETGIPQRLKEVGFDDQCFGYYESNKLDPKCPLLILNFNNAPLTEEESKRPGMYEINHRNSKLPQWAFSAPTYEQVVNWFLRNNNINITTSCVRKDEWIWSMHFIEKEESVSSDDLYVQVENSCIEKLIFSSKEEALISAFKKAIVEISQK